MSVPDKLADWTLAAITDLVESGYSESDRFDFKEKINEGDRKSAERLRSVCCAFANASGGFLVFGVADAGAARERIVGLPRSTEYGAALADATRMIEPALVLHVQNPHLALPNSNVLVVC
jgi:predicted HTH transcriptional regulator